MENRASEIFVKALGSSLLKDGAARLGAGKTLAAAGVWGSSAPLVAAALGRLGARPVLYITAHLDQADEVADDVEVLTGRAAQILPAWETEVAAPGDTGHITDEVAGERVRLCNLLRHASGEGGANAASETQEPVDFIVAPIMALLQPVPSPQLLELGKFSLGKGQELVPDALINWLVDSGFDHVEQVDQQGEFAHRGGIVDIFPSGTPERAAAGSQAAVRVEFFGDTVESIRRFDLDTQRSTDEIASYDITAVAVGREIDPAKTTTLLDYLSEGTIVCIPEPPEVMDLAGEIYRRMGGKAAAAMHDDEPEALSPVGLHDPQEFFLKLRRFSLVEFHAFAQDQPGQVNLGIRSMERMALNTAEALLELEQLSQVNQVYVYCENEAEEKRFLEVMGVQHPQLAAAVKTVIGHLGVGFQWPDEQVVAVGHHEIFHRYAKVKHMRRVRAGRPIDSLLDLTEGDYVVHVAHGIARFQGLRTLERNGTKEEFLCLRFADNAVLNVPASSINLVQKYIGARHKRPTLSHLGGSGWQNAKQRVAIAVHDMAAQLLRIQAMRAAQQGISYPAGTPWQEQFAQEFLYIETEDQLTSMKQIDQDMLETRPMDRLLCGDVGYGKTELAMRAAFKVVETGKQVAVLVPTTVLAAQHYQTFRERFADYPFHIEHLSRFRTATEQAKIVERLGLGQIDVLIGTHRLLSKDVHFPDLGLVVIDEEQRFGVEHKERLKNLRATVDILTMTATPIPRTLHMALLGLRDISSLSTPPLDRRAIHTEVRPYDDELLRQAIYHELNRQGQVFLVHNRVMDIDSLAAHVHSLAPEARVEVAHGQMPEGTLERTMLRLVRQEIDVLVCTTIIESGLDIPTANTMIIHEADHFGLAELHQLRGRVGRYKHRAYCYLLLPQTRTLSAVAAKRLKAIEEFSDLGAGFAIAMRDLEIRGAGNILGPQQSGHIATVGYELYCQLLEKAVHQLRGDVQPVRHDVHVELGIESLIPRQYIPAERQRMEVYRRMARCTTEPELRQLQADLQDAYGPLPAALQQMLDLAEVRVRAGQLGVSSIILMKPDIVLTFRDFKPAQRLFEGARGTVRLPDDKTVHWRPPPAYLEMPTLLKVLLNRLRQAKPAV